MPAVVAALWSAGCGGGAAPESELGVGEVSFAITSVPSSVQCIQIVASGSQVVTQNFTATGGSSSTFSLGRLPLGSVSFAANAYDVACGSISGVQAAWIADPVALTLKAGVVTNLSLNLRQHNPVTATANFVGNVVQMTMGQTYTMLLLGDGTIRTAGASPSYTAWTTAAADTIPAFTGVVEIAGGDSHVCARKGDGTVWCVGSNTYGQIGSGVAVGSYSMTPIQVSGISGATQIAAGIYHTCALASGGAYCWGNNSSGQLGNGTTTTSSTPVLVSNAGNADRIYGGYSHSCYTSGPNTYCWGANTYGQLGDGTTTNRTTPVLVSGPGAVVNMALGVYFSCALRADGTVRCWGWNSMGQLGDGTTVNHSTPALVAGLNDAAQVAAGWYTVCARRQSGAVSCWGYNADGALGDGTSDDKSSPQVVPGVSGASSIAMGYQSVCSLLDNQSISCWGYNRLGQLGDGTRIEARYKPVQMLVQ